MPNSDLLRVTNESQLVSRDAMSVQRQPTPMEMIAAIARDPSIPVDRIAALIGLQERMEAREAEKAYNQDFAAAMLEMPKVAKRGKKDMTKRGDPAGSGGVIPYETYEDLDAAIRPIETRYGFARSFSTRLSDKGSGVILVLTLTHRAGHSTTSERYCAPDEGPGRNAIQALGSGESYGRRYLTKSKWNIVTVGADDDGDTADPISEQQAMDLHDMLDALAMTPTQAERFWAWVGPPAVNVATIQRKDFERVAAWLRQRVKQGGER